MSPRDQADFVADGRDVGRREAFRAGAGAVRAWERERPMTLDRYLSLVHALQDVLGPAPARPPRPQRGPFRL